MIDNELQKKLRHLPGKPGAYMMKDEHGDVIYVGKALSLRNRVRSYFQKGQTQTAKVHLMMTKVHTVDWLVTDSEVEALMLECNLIKKFRPFYNIRLRDDKHYPYLCVTTTELFPRVIVVRRVKKDGNRYFGPYADATSLRESLKLIRKIFRIRGCNKKLTGLEHDKPCLNYHMGQCDCPCAGLISSEDYRKLVDDAILFLEGRQESVAARLEGEMIAASDALEFERAARFRDQIDAIRKLTEKQKVISTALTEQDIVAISGDGGSACVQLFAVRAGKLAGEEHFFLEGIQDETPQVSVGEFVKQYYRDAAFVPKEILVSHEPVETEILEEWLSTKRGGKVSLINPKRGEKRRLVLLAAENARMVGERQQTEMSENAEEAARDLEDLKESLGLTEPPHRIEAYDISNTQGMEAVGSMVVFEDGFPAKAQYRRFKIRTIDQPDDYGMMKEVLNRRFVNAAKGDGKFSSLPDLVLIDGGRGQLNAAQEVLSRFPLVIQTASLAKRLEEVYLPSKMQPLLLPRDSRALRLLQRIRDEAHRFALTYHQKLRDKSTRRSILDTIPGVGPQRKKALIKKFGSVAGLKRASLEEILSATTITPSVAKSIYEALHID